MKTVHLFQCLFVVLCLGFTGCQEDDSPTEGPQGEQGPPGEDGNANVIASEWIPSGFSNTATTFVSFDISDSNLTQSVLDTGLVLAFGRIEGNVISVPFVYSNKSYYIGILPGRIRFIGSSTNGNNQIFNDCSHFRYVIIPSSTSGKNNIDFTAMSYEEVMDYFGLTH